MLKPVKAPLECFGLDYKKTDPICQSCPHVADCCTFMGTRLDRIAVNEAKFCLIPEGFKRRVEEPDESRRDIEAIYIECWRQVFGTSPIGRVGSYEDKIVTLAKTAAVTVPMFILINMFGHDQAYPDKIFRPGTLIDNRALNRVSTYAAVCHERFGTLNTRLLDAVTDGDLAVYDLEKRMLGAEVMAGDWIIKFKLWHPGLPFDAMFADIECELEPYWLVTEQRYKDILLDYSKRLNQPKDPRRLEARHAALEVFQAMKKRKHQGISNFRIREKIMPQAVKDVLHLHGYAPSDFEIENKPILDPLMFWHRLGMALQHLECLLFVNYGEGIYARS